MAKRPFPGSVKTRLCPPLTPQEAAELAQAMLDDTVAKCLGCGEFETSIAAAPAEDVDWFRGRYPQVGEIAAQEGSGLGERLAHRFERAAVDRPGWTLVCVGADAPHVPVERIVTAHAALESGADLVLGPDRGGGYYLVGSKRSHAGLFTRIPMSTSDMCQRTVAFARSLGLAVHLLEPDFDVDDADDLELLAGGAAPSLTSAALARVLLRRS